MDSINKKTICRLVKLMGFWRIFIVFSDKTPNTKEEIMSKSQSCASSPHCHLSAGDTV
jgi:hypothetical protein